MAIGASIVGRALGNCSQVQMFQSAKHRGAKKCFFNQVWQKSWFKPLEGFQDFLQNQNWQFRDEKDWFFLPFLKVKLLDFDSF